MKKIFTILAVLGALTFMAVPAQALVGMPDDQPGCDAVWWFLTDMNYPASGVNTLAVFWEVDVAAWNWHYTVFTKRSESVYNDELWGTRADIISTDGYTITQMMAPLELAKLEIDLDGDSVNDHYFGYVYFDRDNPQRNNVVGQTLLVKLGAGLASSANIHMKEYFADVDVRYPAQMTDGNGIELFNANALKASIDALADDAYTAPTFLQLPPRYRIADSNGHTYLIVWNSTNNPGQLHVNFWNAYEDKVSSNINLPDELDIIDIETILPAVLHSGYPKEGWIDITTPDINGNGFGTGTLEWLAWTWQTAIGSAQESWSILNPVPRRTNDPEYDN